MLRQLPAGYGSFTSVRPSHMDNHPSNIVETPALFGYKGVRC